MLLLQFEKVNFSVKQETALDRHEAPAYLCGSRES
jgi:hypothetical protein